MTTHKVHVYGTLRTGDENTQTVKGRLYNVGWFPALILDPDGYDVTVEVREVDDDGLEGFDAYEGYRPDYPSGSLYIRRKHKDGWIYEFNRSVDDLEEIPEGDWLAFKKEKEGV